MPDLIYLLAVLACPVGMGMMMLFMMRPGDKSDPDNEVAELRAEVERLRTAHNSSPEPDAASSQPPTWQ